MAVETLDDLNAQSCCCDLTLCPIPTEVCESLSHTSYCGDNDYTDSVAALADWEADRDAWVVELQLAWEADRDAWVAEDPENRLPGDYPVPPPAPRDPGDYPVSPPPTPVKPDGYDDGTRACFGPFKEPTGDPEDDLALIWNKMETVFTQLYSGVGWRYASGGDASDSSEVLVIFTYGGYSADGAIGSYTESRSGNSWDSINEICTTLDPGGIIIGPPEATSVDYILGTPTAICEDAESGTQRTDTSESGDATPRSLLGCPASGIFSTDDETGWDYTMVEKDSRVLSEGKSKSDLIARAISNLPATWPETPEGSTCGSTTTATWPKNNEVHVGGWPACDSVDLPWLPNPVADSIQASANKSRTRWQIPATWADQVTGLTVPFTGTYFLITFDIIDEPEGWDATIDDPDYVPPVPNDPPEPVPQIPDPDAPYRSFYLVNQFVTWTGPGTGDADDLSWLTDWVEIPARTTPGTRRIVNRRLVCRENWRFGVIPQVWGEAVDLTPPTEDFSFSRNSIYIPLI